jgi:hypothetical protein
MDHALNYSGYKFIIIKSTGVVILLAKIVDKIEVTFLLI